MERQMFERLVRQAVGTIPDELRQCLDNVDIVVEPRPTREQLAYHRVDEDSELLLGLYEGVPLTEREDYQYILPDLITIFQQPIESICTTNEEIVEEIRMTVAEEVAHHFGISDERLEELGVLGKGNPSFGKSQIT